MALGTPVRKCLIAELHPKIAWRQTEAFDRVLVFVSSRHKFDWLGFLIPVAELAENNHALDVSSPNFGMGLPEQSGSEVGAVNEDTCPARRAIVFQHLVRHAKQVLTSKRKMLYATLRTFVANPGMGVGPRLPTLSALFAVLRPIVLVTLLVAFQALAPMPLMHSQFAGKEHGRIPFIVPFMAPPFDRPFWR